MSRITVAAFLAVLAGNLALLYGADDYKLGVEFAVCWLPALIASMHGVGLRRRTAERLAAMRGFADALRFGQVRLFENTNTSGPLRQGVLQVICRAVALYSQKELRIAMGTAVTLPI